LVSARVGFLGCAGKYELINSTETRPFPRDLAITNAYSKGVRVGVGIFSMLNALGTIKGVLSRMTWMSTCRDFPLEKLLAM
jgi:hypothetical protein